MSDNREPIWVADDEVIAISNQAVALFGGHSGALRDESLLQAAMGRPLDKWHYDDPRPDIFALAAAYCFALVKGHVFHDGNKCTAYIVAIVFLELNGFVCAPDQIDIIRTMLGAADGSVGESRLANWFRKHSVPITSSTDV